MTFISEGAQIYNRFFYRFIPWSFRNDNSIIILNEENGHHLKKSFRIIFDLLLDLSQAFRNDRELHFRYDRRNLHFGMIGASFRDVLSLL